MRVLVLGISGQDGFYLSELLMQEGEEVFGLLSPTRFAQNFVFPETCSESQVLSIKNSRIDLSVKEECIKFLDKIKPDRIIHLAAIHSNSSRMQELETSSSRAMDQVHVAITENILFWIEKNMNTRLFIALSSQMFSPIPGEITTINEESEAHPQNHYGKTKNDSWTLVKQSRHKYGTLVSTGIFFNHTSPKSRPGFLFSSIGSQLVEFIEGRTREIRLRNFTSLVDIIHAREAVECLWKITNNFPNMDFVVGSGQLVSIENVVRKSCLELGFEELPKLTSSERNSESGFLVSDISKAKDLLGWDPSIHPSSILTEITRSLAT